MTQPCRVDEIVYMGMIAQKMPQERPAFMLVKIMQPILRIIINTFPVYHIALVV